LISSQQHVLVYLYDMVKRMYLIIVSIKHLMVKY